jgi:hypothetical protein
MPEIVPRELKSEISIANEPERMTSKIQLIIALDICGYTGNQIAEQTGMTASRISIIRNSPLFIQERDSQRARLTAEVIGKKSDSIVAGDPVENEIKDLALKAVGVHKAIMETGKGEMSRIASANSILDRAGYKAKTDKTVVSVEVTERMADRFERVLKRTVVTHED